MSNYSHRPRKDDIAAPEAESSERSARTLNMSDHQALLEAEAQQSPLEAIGSWFQNLFGGGQRESSQGAQQASSQGQQVTSVETGLGEDVDRAILASPTLATKVDQILSDGWVIRWSQPGEQGSFCRRADKTIVINERNRGNNHSVVGTIAHEVGHAITPLERHSRNDPNYADKMVRAHLRNEAEAVVFNIECAQETDSGLFDTEDMGVRAPNGCRQLYDQYSDGQITREQMIDGIADLIGKARPSTAPEMNYTEYYAQYYTGASRNVA